MTLKSVGYTYLDIYLKFIIELVKFSTRYENICQVEKTSQIKDIIKFTTCFSFLKKRANTVYNVNRMARNYIALMNA